MNQECEDIIIMYNVQYEQREMWYDCKSYATLKVGPTQTFVLNYLIMLKICICSSTLNISL